MEVSNADEDINDPVPIAPPKKSALKSSNTTNTQRGKGKSRGKGKGKGRGKKTILAFDDEDFTCSHCKKVLPDKAKFIAHTKGETKCGLLNKIARLEKNFNKLKEASVSEIEELEEKVEKIHKVNIADDPLSIPEERQKALKSRLCSFDWPEELSRREQHRYKKIFKDSNEAFDHFFNKFINSTSSTNNRKMGVMIRNSAGQIGLVIKRNNELFLDTSGIVPMMLKEFFFDDYELFSK